MDVQLQIKVDNNGGGCYDGSCNARYAIDGGQGGYVVRGRPVNADVAAAVAAVDGTPAEGEIELWVPGPVIEG